jgi:hypothetical protein
MHPELRQPLSTFQANVVVVEGLLEFGNLIIAAAVEGLRKVEVELEAKHLNSIVDLVRNRARMLENIKTESLRPQYEAMFNQCVVLLVSHFGSAVHSLFRNAVESALRTNSQLPVVSHELKVSWQSVTDSDEPKEALFAELLISQQDLSFQDMQSIGRAFKTHLKVEIPKDRSLNNIIAGQASRHVIVHNAGRVDGRMVRQLRDAEPRDLATSLSPGATVTFAPSEIRVLAESMTSYLSTLKGATERSLAAS